MARSLLAMPRTARASVGGMAYHVLNRGNGRQQVFFKDGDYTAFLKALGHACTEVEMRVLAHCLMPNRSRRGSWSVFAEVCPVAPLLVTMPGTSRRRRDWAWRRRCVRAVGRRRRKDECPLFFFGHRFRSRRGRLG